MQLVIVFCNSYMHDDYITVMRMSSAYPGWGRGGHVVGLLANQEDCKIGGAKLTFSPRGGGIWQGKVSWVKCFSLKSPPDIYLKKLGFTWLIHFNFNYTWSLLSRRSLLRTTVNMDHSGTREMDLAIKRQEEWGNSLVANSRSGNVIPPATLSSVGTRTVVFTLTSDIQTTHQSNALALKIYYLWGNLSCLFLLWFVMRND